MIPVAFDPTPPERPSPQPSASEQSKTLEERSRDYFNRTHSSDSRPSRSPAENHTAYQEMRHPTADQARQRPDDSTSSTPDVTDKPSQQHPSSHSDSYGGNDGDTFESQDARDYAEQDTASKPHSEKSGPTQLSHPPKRGDSLESRLHQNIHNKELAAATKSSQNQEDSKGESAAEHVAPGSKTAESRTSKHSSSPSTPTAAPRARAVSSNAAAADDFTPSRAARQPSMDNRFNHGVGETANATPSELKTSSQQEALLRYSAGGEFTMDEDMARIIGAVDGTQSHESFLRRVSNSVRHGRSFSDKGQRSSKEHKLSKSPQSGSSFAPEISSPTGSLPDHRDELAWYKNELKREREKVQEKDQKISELETSLNATVNIKQVNTELREKRSTMVFLDAQKEITLRELEVLTEQIAEEKHSGAPLDMQKLSNSVLRGLAESIRGLKDSLTSQIEESIQKRDELVKELGELGRMKDKSFQEFEQLSLKNAQLAELNNQLVHQIQELYKANTGATATTTAAADGGRSAPNGLGIYSHQKDKSSTTSVEAREGRRPAHDGSLSGSTAEPSEEAESAAVVQGPQVVSIRKAQPRKFNWKRGQHVAKGVTKGLKGAFSYQRDGQFAESPYAYTPSQDSSSGSGAPRSQGHDAARQGFGFFGHQKNKPTAVKVQSNGTPPASADAPVGTFLPLVALYTQDLCAGYHADFQVGLFGTELEQRLEIEKGVIPSVVTHCIEEVELRGIIMHRNLT